MVAEWTKDRWMAEWWLGFILLLLLLLVLGIEPQGTLPLNHIASPFLNFEAGSC